MDPIGNPHGCLDQLFEKKMNEASNSPCHASFEEIQYFNALVEDVDFVSRIPYFARNHVESITPNTLVRYQCLIQDMFDPEFYSAAHFCRGKNKYVLSKYCDSIPQCQWCGGFGGDDDCILERLAMLCIPIPGTSSWCDESCVLSSRSDRYDARQSGKRRMSDSERGEDARDDGMQRATRAKAVSDAPALSSGRHVVDVPHRPSDCSLVKVYNGQGEALRLLDMVEVVGIYTADPSLGAKDDSVSTLLGDGLLESDDQLSRGAYPPASVAPRLHSLVLRRLGSSFPLLVQVSGDDHSLRNRGVYGHTLRSLLGSDSAQALVPAVNGRFLALASRHVPEGSCAVLNRLSDAATLSTVRGRVLEALITALGGDPVAAEYVLLAALSHVYEHRLNCSVVLGAAPIRLCGLRTDDPRRAALVHTLSRLLPRCVTIKADPASLNAEALRPVRDCEFNCMSPSRLQVGAGTLLIVDEGITDTPAANEDVGLSAVGRQSVEALLRVVSSQQLAVDCGFSEVVLPTDLPCVLLSSDRRGGGALSAVECVSVQMLESVVATCASDLDDDARLWWAVVRLVRPAMDESVQEIATRDFLAARQQHGEVLVDEADFHRWLTLARLVALSFGERHITAHHWGHMRTLEMARLAREAQFFPTVTPSPDLP